MEQDKFLYSKITWIVSDTPKKSDFYLVVLQNRITKTRTVIFNQFIKSDNPEEEDQWIFEIPRDCYVYAYCQVSSIHKPKLSGNHRPHLKYRIDSTKHGVLSTYGLFSTREQVIHYLYKHKDLMSSGFPVINEWMVVRGRDKLTQVTDTIKEMYIQKYGNI